MQDIKFIKGTILDAQAEIQILLDRFYVLKNMEFEDNRVEASFTLEDAPGSTKYTVKLIREKLNTAESVIEGYTALGYTVEFTQTEQNYVFAFLKLAVAKPAITSIVDAVTESDVTADSTSVKITGTAFDADSATKELDSSDANFVFGDVTSWTDTEIVVDVTVGGTPPYSTNITVENYGGTSENFALSVLAGA